MLPEAYLRRILGKDVQFPGPDDPDDKFSIANVRSQIYERARRYWHEQGKTDRAALSDTELDVQFWTFDKDGIPRLHVARAFVEDHGPNPLLKLARAAPQIAS